AVVGVQRDTGSSVAQYECTTNASLAPGLKLTFTLPPCGPTTPTVTATACPMNFSDVSPSDYFYTAVRYLYCAGVISGYADGYFRPFNNTTRGQLSKIIVLAVGWTDPCPTVGHFSDVPPGSTYLCFIETAYAHEITSGYADG